MANIVHIIFDPVLIACLAHTSYMTQIAQRIDTMYKIVFTIGFGLGYFSHKINHKQRKNQVLIWLCQVVSTQLLKPSFKSGFNAIS